MSGNGGNVLQDDDISTCITMLQAVDGPILQHIVNASQYCIHDNTLNVTLTSTSSCDDVRYVALVERDYTLVWPIEIWKSVK